MTTPNYSGSSTTSAGQGSDSGAKEQAKATAGTAKDQAQNVAGTAKEQAQNVAGTAKQEAANVAGEARDQARNLLEEARVQANDQATTQRDRLVSLLQDFSSQMEKMANGEGAPSGMAQDLVRQAADRARTISSSMEGREPGELIDDVRRFARRKPGTFLLGALAAGVLAGRVTKGAKEANSGGTSGMTGVYDNPRGTSAGYPTAGTGYPATDPVYPAGTGTTPTTGTGTGTTGTGTTTAAGTGSISPGGATGEGIGGTTGADSPWTDNPTTRGVQ